MSQAVLHLVKVIQDLSRARTLDAVTEIVRKAARSLVNADGASFVLRDHGYCFYADEDAIAPLWKGKRFPMEACVSGWVMIHKSSAIIPNIYEDERVPIDAYRPTFVRSMAMIPIRADDPLGAIGTYWAQSHAPSPEDISLLQALADSTSVALENVRLFDSLENRIADLSYANRTKDEFLMTVSHELRTPLNAIMGWAEVMLCPNASVDERNTGIRTIERNARIQEHIINDLIDTARITTGRMKFDSKLCDLESLVGAARDSLTLALESKSIELTMNLSHDTGQIFGDAERLQQIVWNLLSNAIKFTPRGGRIQVQLDRDDSMQRLVVTDSGIGIEPVFLPYVFDRFTQSDSTSTRNFGGLGLGLAIVKHLVDAHGGRIEARSEGRGKGSSFLVYLPLAKQKTSFLHEGFSSEQDVMGLLSGLKILAVDDESDARLLISTVLRRNGAQVCLGVDAPSAFEALQVFKPDLFISDISMPGEDGYSLLRRIRALGAESGGDTPSIALTAFADQEHREEAKSAGFNAFLAKPLHTGQVISTILGLSPKA